MYYSILHIEYNYVLYIHILYIIINSNKVYIINMLYVYI